MESVTTNQNSENAQSANSNDAASESGQTSPKPIGDFLAQPDFPECVRGEFVDIGGYSGTVIDIVGSSLKVRSPEATTRSFNFHALRRLYGPREEPEPVPSPSVAPSASTEEETAAPKRNVITAPNFSAPVKPISEFTGRADYPQCTFGQYVDIAGYKGVVVEIVNRSLKVRSLEETTRSYNADVLSKVHGSAGKG